jgi:hypothetical protein
MKQLSEMNHAELQRYALDSIEQGIELWKQCRAQIMPDEVIFVDEHSRALHRRELKKAVELLCPASFERVCRFGPSAMRDVVQFDGDEGRYYLQPRRLLDFIDEAIAGAAASARYLRNHLENNE